MTDFQWNAQIKALVYRVQKQDKQALQLLYSEAGSKLLGIIVRIIPDRAEAEDVLQEVIIKLWQQAKKYSGEGSAWGWLCVMTRHAALDRLRKLQNRPHISSDEHEGLMDGLISELDEANNHSVNHCLQQLKQDMRKSVLFAYVHGYSHSELATKLGAPLGTVKAWVRRGLQELKQCLEA